jgi:fused signal recognition particle receptor
VPTLHLDPIQLCILIALAAQIPVAALAILTVFSQRKKLPSAQPPVQSGVEPVSARGEVTPPAPASAERGVSERPSPQVPARARERDAAPAPIAPAPPSEIAPRQATQTAPIETAQAEAVAPEPTPAGPEPESVPVAPPEERRRSPVRIGLGLRKTRENFLARVRAAITGSARADDIYEGLEEALIGADVGVEGSLKLVEAVRARLKNDARPEVIRDALKEEIERVLLAAERPMADSGDAPLVIMLAGVNGVGKTTTVAKLAALLKVDRGPVLVAAADTFRAAAIDQLQVWCDRAGVDLIKQKPGSDPAAVAFDAVKAAVARNAKAVLIDTAGRLQTKVNLMEELKKIARVVGRELPGAPHETWLVLDATTGQNALSQAKLFGEAVPLTGVVLAKLDSTAKGGVIVGIAERLKLPVRYVGLGENLEDLRRFDAREFAEALFSESDSSAESASGSYAA